MEGSHPAPFPCEWFLRKGHPLNELYQDVKRRPEAAISFLPRAVLQGRHKSRAGNKEPDEVANALACPNSSRRGAAGGGEHVHASLPRPAPAEVLTIQLGSLCWEIRKINNKRSKKSTCSSNETLIMLKKFKMGVAGWVLGCKKRENYLWINS